MITYVDLIVQVPCTVSEASGPIQLLVGLGTPAQGPKFREGKAQQLYPPLQLPCATSHYSGAG